MNECIFCCNSFPNMIDEIVFINNVANIFYFCDIYCYNDWCDLDMHFDDEK